MTGKRTLMDLTADMQALDDLLAEVGGDITDPTASTAIEQWFNELDNGMQAKVDSYCALIAEYEARAKVRQEEAERLAGRARLDTDNARWLRQRMLAALGLRGLRKLETTHYTVSVVRNGGKQPLDLHGEVPADWCLTKTEVLPDRERIRAALEAGTALPFATLSERGERLAIK